MNQNSNAAIAPSEPILTAETQREPGSFGRRILASFIDGVILSILQSPLTWGVGRFMKSGDLTAVTVINGFVIPMAVAYFYYGFFYSTKGASLGKAQMGLKVVRDDNGGFLSYGHAFARETVGKLISLIPLGIGFFWALSRPDRKTFHDLIFKTQVVRDKKCS
jgi:uncharacterized RDD family membrane protein YckC